MRFTKLLLGIATVASLAATNAHAVPITGLRGTNMLFDFDSNNTLGVNTRAITGVTGTLVAIDYRPATNVLYGLSSDGSLYTINAATGAATLAPTLVFPMNASLTGTSFDISFNPVADRLRIVSDTGQNLRVNVDTGVVSVDTALSTDGGATTKTGIVGAAYTNQVAGAAVTTLYDVTSITLYIQNPPNNGTLILVAPTSAVGINAFDIDGITNNAYIAGNVAFATINLATGAVGIPTSFGFADEVDFAIAPRVAAVPEPLPIALFGAGLAGLFAARRRRRTA